MESKNELILKNIGLVYNLIRPYVGAAEYIGFDKEDLFQTGCLGIVKASKSFDYARGYQFSTYAVSVAVGYIRNMLRDNKMVHVSRVANDLYFKIRGLEKKLKRELTIEEIKNHFGVTEKQIKDCLGSMKCYVSLNGMIKNEGDKNVSFIEAIEDRKNGENTIYENLQHVELIQHINRLPTEERNVVLLRLQEKTQPEIGTELGISQTTVHRLLKKAIKHLKESYQEEQNEEQKRN